MQVTFEYIGHGGTRWTTTSSRNGSGIMLGASFRWEEQLFEQHNISGYIEVAPQIFAKFRVVVQMLDDSLLVVLERVDSRVLRESEALLKAGWKKMASEVYEEKDTEAQCGLGGCAELAQYCPGHDP